MFSVRIIRAGRRPLVHLGGSAPVWEGSSLRQLGSGSVWLGTGVRESSRVALWLPVRLAQTPDDVSAFSSVVFLFLLFIRFFGNISASGPRGGVRQEESEQVVSSPAVDSRPKWCIGALRFSLKKWQRVPELLPRRPRRPRGLRPSLCRPPLCTGAGSPCRAGRRADSASWGRVSSVGGCAQLVAWR